MIGKIQRLPLREVWKHEALDFTTWLEDNVDVLSDVLDLSLASVEREQDAGDFKIDLVAESSGGETVIIENQLERSNHDHLGKLLTYLAALNAKAAVWIVAEPRPEHIRAVGWLNESGLASFYLLKLEAIKIGDSEPAPLLTLITGPSEESKEVGDKKKELTGRHDARYRFFEGLLGKAKHQTRLHANISPGPANWVAASAGRSGLAFNYVVLKHSGRVELYVDTEHFTGEANSAIFEALRARQTEIEKEFGGPIDWDPLDGARACRISVTINTGGWRDEEKWPAVQDAMIDTMVRFEKALRPWIDKL